MYQSRWKPVEGSRAKDDIFGAAGCEWRVRIRKWKDEWAGMSAALHGEIGQAFLNGVFYELGGVVDVEFGFNLVPVVFYRPRADVQ